MTKKKNTESIVKDIKRKTRHPHSSIGDILRRKCTNRFGEEFFPEREDITADFINFAMS